jgi:putative polyketide hydroxylase
VHPAGELGDVAGRFSAAYGVSGDGAVLIRPDGFIAWRHAAAADADGAGAFERALGRLSGRHS